VPGLVAPVARVAAAAVLLAALALGLRYEMVRTPVLSETYYDEAMTGLMALDILQGRHQAFFYGEPYGGSVGDAYIAAAAFRWLGPSTGVLRMSGALVTVLWPLAAAALAWAIAGPWAGLLAGLLLAVPPVFLSYVELSSQGEAVAMTLAAVVLACAARLADHHGHRGRRSAAAAWAALGLAAGFGWWASQMTLMCLVAAALWLVVARPRSLREPGPYAAVGLFALASAPFWVWNWRHEWATIRHFASWGPPLPDWPARVRAVTASLLASLQGAFWDAHAVDVPAALAWLGWGLVATVYVPALGLAVLVAGRWARRLARRERPWRDPLDLVALAFWLTVAAHLTTTFGAQGVLRYAITFYATLPVLAAAWLVRVGRWRPAGPPIAAALAVLLAGHHLATHALFVREAQAQPVRPVDAVIARLEALGIRGCYADSRVAQVIAFESLGRVPCADFTGYRNFTLLQAVDAIEDPDAVAIVAHWRLQSPSPEVVAETLRLMGAEARQERIGDYVVFHHVRLPDLRVRPVPPVGWAARASAGAEQAGRVFDRQVWTRWSASKQGGEWLLLDLGRAHPVAQLSLEAGPFRRDGPAGLRVETSADGRVWDVAAQAAGILPGLHWWKGHPRRDETARVIVRLAPRPVRFLRIVQTGRDEPGVLWSVSEAFVYEAADGPWTPPPDAVAAGDRAGAALARWMDDPTGPHPQRAPVTYEHRRAQVRWADVFAGADRALALAPEWEDAHHLYTRALILSGWNEVFDLAVERARADGAWREVVRWADLADARAGTLWRSGRADARAEAWARLGGSGTAPPVREAAPSPAPPPLPQPVGARYGGVLDLTGVDVPARLRPGDRVTIRYGWRAVARMPADYAAFVHLSGPGRVLNLDHWLGGDFGTSRWAAGERVEETLTWAVPADAPPGTYALKVGVWQPARRARLPVAAADREVAGTAVVVATITIDR
jgi:hypothetical protein